MSLAVLTGLALQISALAILFAKLKGSWLRHLGAIFIVLACTYHGLGEVLMALYPGRNPYRAYLTDAQVDAFVLAISAAILLLTIVYLAAVRAVPTAQVVDREELAGVLNWKALLLVTAPLAYWTIQGTGRLASAGYLGSDATNALTASSGLSDQFLTLALAATGIGIVLRFGPRLVIPVLLVQLTILASIGQRNEVIVGAIVFMYAVARTGLAPSKRTLRVLAGLGVIVFLLLTSVRANEGREAFGAGVGASDRLGAIQNGITGIANENTREELRATAGYRLDGNSFGAMELASIEGGDQPLGLTPLWNNIRLAVPSALDPSKIGSPLEDRSEKFYAQKYLGMPVTDILVTQLGGTVGYFGLWSLFAAAVLIGLALALLDTYLSRPLTSASLLLGIGALNALAAYGRGLEAWTLTLRGLLPILAVVLVIQTMRRQAVAVRERREGGLRQTPSRVSAGRVTR